MEDSEDYLCYTLPMLSNHRQWRRKGQLMNHPKGHVRASCQLISDQLTSYLFPVLHPMIFQYVYPEVFFPRKKD